MDETLRHLQNPPRVSGMARILQAWRLLLIGFLAGGLVGAAIFALFPPPYRAEAVEVLDQNLEKSYPDSPDREVFYFLERETNRLEELAWSDAVLQRVVDELKDTSLAELRGGDLQLSQPSDGGWRFYGISSDAGRAKKLADAWADAFEREVRRSTSAATRLDTVRAQLADLNARCPVTCTAEITDLQQQIEPLSAQSHGIHPLVTVYRSQEKGMTVQRSSSLGVYIFAGAITGLFLMILGGSFYFRDEKDVD